MLHVHRGHRSWRREESGEKERGGRKRWVLFDRCCCVPPSLNCNHDHAGERDQGDLPREPSFLHFVWTPVAGPRGVCVWFFFFCVFFWSLVLLNPTHTSAPLLRVSTPPSCFCVYSHLSLWLPWCVCVFLSFCRPSPLGATHTCFTGTPTGLLPLPVSVCCSVCNTTTEHASTHTHTHTHTPSLSCDLCVCVPVSGCPCVRFSVMCVGGGTRHHRFVVVSFLLCPSLAHFTACRPCFPALCVTLYAFLCTCVPLSVSLSLCLSVCCCHT